MGFSTNFEKRLSTSFLKWPVRQVRFDVWKAPWGLYSPHDKIEKKTLIQQQSGNFSWRPRAQIEQLAWPVAERQIGHRKSCLVLSARSTDVPVLLLNQPLITSQLQVLRNIVWIVTRLTTIERVVLHMTAKINRRFCSLVSNACLSQLELTSPS